MLQDVPFIRRIKQNHFRPKDGSEPLTVIEFSMMPAMKDALEKKLHPYVSGEKSAETKSGKKEIATIIEDSLPKEVIQYFKEIKASRAEDIAPYVYVIRNLPEIPEAEIEKYIKDTPHDLQIDEIEKPTYSSLIAEGIALLTNHDFENILLTRKYTKKPYMGNFHKDAEDISILSGAYQHPSTKTSTGFLDLNNVVETANENFQNDDFGGELLVDKQEKELCQMNDQDDILAALGAREYYAPYYSDKDAAQQSMSLEIGHGDMVVFSNHGRLYHKAMPTEMLDDKHFKEGELMRAIVVNMLDKTEQSKHR